MSHCYGLVMDESHEDTHEIYDDAPETPAPLFAIRAFKYALFGTPKPSDQSVRRMGTQPRRNVRSSNSSSIGRGFNTTQPKQGTKRITGMENTTPQLTPQKPAGILVTPGTAGKNRKTVSFNATKRVTENNPFDGARIEPTPKDVPGRFPSPNKQTDKGSARSTTDRGYEQKDAEFRLRPFVQMPDGREPEEAVEDLQNPMSPSGRYWKSVHECYSDKSQLEMRKLEKKEQIAKKFARSKDEEVAQLKEELEAEKQKVEALEAKLQKYVELLERPSSQSNPRDTEHHRHQHKERKPERPRRRTSGHTGSSAARSKSINFQSDVWPEIHNSFDTSKTIQARISAAAMEPAKNMGSSDIWADLDSQSVHTGPERTNSIRGLDVSETKRQPRSFRDNTPESRPRKERKPLSSTDGNQSRITSSDMQFESKPGAEDGNAAVGNTGVPLVASSTETATLGTSGRWRRSTSQMSVDRREAAKKRLEERRMARLGC